MRALVLTLLLGAGLTSVARAESRIVYLCGSNVCDVRPDGSGKRRLTRDGKTTDPYIRPTRSADGSRLGFGAPNGHAYVADSNGKHRQDFSGGHALVHPTRPYALVVSDSFSADIICRVHLSGARRGCTVAEGTWTWGPGLDLLWRPPGDQDRVELRDMTNGGTVAGTVVAYPRASNHRFGAYVTLSPDGRRMAVSESVSDDESRIVLFDIRRRRRLRDLTRGHYDSAPSWSPSGREIAFARGGLYEGAIVRIDVGSGRVRTVTRPARFPYWAY